MPATLTELASALPFSTSTWRQQCVNRGLSKKQAVQTFGREISAKAKATLTDYAEEIARNRGLPRHEAWQAACAEHPDLRRNLVIGHNLKFGRVGAAKVFAEDFPTSSDD